MTRPRKRTRVVMIDPVSPDQEVLRDAARVIRRGGLVGFPTETVYGLGANALDAEAVRRIFVAKGRPAGNPVIVHVGSADGARALAAEWPAAADALAERFWPGSLTLVVRRAGQIPDAVTAGGATVGVRCPAHPVALALIEASGTPIAAPSANRSARISPTMADHVLSQMAGRIDLVLDGGPTSGGLESTVLDVTVSPARVLRPGPVTAAELASVVGSVSQTPAAEEGQGRLRSPGLLPRHYAPAAPVTLAAAGGLDVVLDLVDQGRRVGWLSLAPTASSESPQGVVLECMPASPRAYAAVLYAALHAMESACVDSIVIDLPPDSEEWLAIRDRLTRAAAPA